MNLFKYASLFATFFFIADCHRKYKGGNFQRQNFANNDEYSQYKHEEQQTRRINEREHFYHRKKQ